MASDNGTWVRCRPAGGGRGRRGDKARNDCGGARVAGVGVAHPRPLRLPGRLFRVQALVAGCALGGHEGMGGEESQGVRGLVETPGAHRAVAMGAADRRLSALTLRRAVSALTKPIITRSGRWVEVPGSSYRSGDDFWWNHGRLPASRGVLAFAAAALRVLLGVLACGVALTVVPSPLLLGHLLLRTSQRYSTRQTVPRLLSL